MTGHDDGPLVSFVMSNYRGAKHLEAAVASVLAQSHGHLELIVVDDASDDDSGAILDRLARADSRLKPVMLATNGGPGRARNAALEAARGDWVAIVDADDFIHPERTNRLLRAAAALGADMIADNPVYFGSLETAGQTLLDDWSTVAPFQLDLADLIRSDTAHGGRSSLGYLKPMIRADRLSNRRYDADLRIGEDFDLYFRLLLDGARFHVLPDPTYLYRRHAGSISHRLSADALDQLNRAQARAVRSARKSRPNDAPLHGALARRGRTLGRAARYARLVEAIKARRHVEVALQIGRNPSLFGNLTASFIDRRRRKAKFCHSGETGRRTVVLASPERLDGIFAPQDALRIAVLPMCAPATRSGDTHVALARRLAIMSSRGPLDLVVDGEEGRHAAGYVPQDHRVP